MLASVLRSPRAILVNIEIVRAFVRMHAIDPTGRSRRKIGFKASGSH